VATGGAAGIGPAYATGAVVSRTASSATPRCGRTALAVASEPTLQLPSGAIVNTSLVPHLPRLDQMRVEDVMHAGLLGCNPSTPLPAIARILAEEHIHCVVVHGVEETREGERLTWGVISDRDLLRALDAGDGGVTAAQLAMPADPTIEVAETLDRAIQLMADYDVSHILVVEKGYPVGMISALDVARAAGGA
jgi:CBS domain-containing protein